jgi:hypothetical protein
VGQTSTEAKREIDQTRAHLTETIEAIQLKARRSLDVGHQLQHNRAVQASLGALILGAASLVVLWNLRRNRRTPAERLARKLKLSELRDRVNDFGDDARAWATAKKRLVKADGKANKVEVKQGESVSRRLLVSAAEAALTAMAAGYAKRIFDKAATPHQSSHPDAGPRSGRR